MGDPGIGGAYQPGRHRHQGPGKTYGEAAAPQTGAPEKRPPPPGGGARTQTGNASGAPRPAIGPGGPGGVAGALRCGDQEELQGYKESWRGFKLHADVSDCCLPISVALTAASLHDSQVAIPLMKLTSDRVDYLYDLMDAAYDAQPIYAVSRSLGHVPIIDKNGRGQKVTPLAPHEAARYKERTVAERFNGRLKEEFGGSNVMVRGAQKVGLHLMFGVIALFADQLLKLIN